MRRSTSALLPVALGCLLLVSCGDDGGSTADDTGTAVDAAADGATDDGATDEAAPATDGAAADDDPTTTDPTTTDPATGGDDFAVPDGSTPAATTIEVTLDEYVVLGPTDIGAGAVELTVSNAGSRAHELVVVRGDGYESLPLSVDGAVLEEEIAPTDVVGRVDSVGSGDSASLTVDLEAGSYVFFCNLGRGPSSHAGRGQSLDVTVS